MKALCFTAALFFLFTLTTAVVVAQPQSLKGSSCIEMNLGLWNEFNAAQQVTAAGVASSAKTNGFLGGVTYCYWMRENVAITIVGSLLSSQATSTVTLSSGSSSSIARFLGSTQQNASTVVSFLVGTRLFVLQPDPSDDVRPYLALAVGSFMGFEASNTLLTQSAHSESAFGGRVGAGLDVFLGSLVKLDANIGYNAMSDFQNAIGARRNFNGMDASMGIGFVF